MRLAMMFGTQSERMLESISRIPEAELDKLSLAQRSLGAGIFADKLCNLSKAKVEAENEGVVNISWVRLVETNTPGRAKDGDVIDVTPEKIKIEEPLKEDNSHATQRMEERTETRGAVDNEDAKK